jgi:hypothetical protein
LSLLLLAEPGDRHLMIIQGVSKMHDTILGVCFMHVTDEISRPLDASSVSLGEFRLGRRAVDKNRNFTNTKQFV